MKKNYLFVYNKHLRNYLLDNNQEFITTAYAISNGNRFWLFEQTEELSDLLNKYNEKYSTKISKN